MESDFSNLKFEYLGEIFSEKPFWPIYQGPRAPIHRIKKCQKSRGTATLTLHLYSLAEDENVTIVDGGSRVSLE